MIGSGAGGGTMVQVLTGLGFKVTLMEAGPLLDPARDFKEHEWPYDHPHRGAGPGAEHYLGGYGPYLSYFTAPHTYWDIPGEPYTVAAGSQFRWLRSRILGGRTNIYARISLRFADYDFEPYSRDGLGTDWPLRYQDLAPYYDKAEAFIGVTGSPEGIRSAPDGVFQAPPPPKVHDVLVRKAAAKLGLRAIAMRRAVITKPLNGRLPCHYCGECERGCKTASNYSSSQVQILPALKSGRLTILDQCMAREILTDDEARVRAVSYIDKRTGEEKQIRCRVLVVAASACESARLLLNSKSSRFPRGLSNNSGVVGKYLTDSVGTYLIGSIPYLRNLPRYNSDGMTGSHLYIPWWGWDDHEKLGFPRGYHIEFGGGFPMPSVGMFDAALDRNGGFGSALKRGLREEYGSFIRFGGRGEMIPNEKSFCEIDPEKKDKWGIPVLRFHFQWSDHERRQAQHMQETFRRLIEALGGTPMPMPTGMDRISVPGTVLHELGTVRMGKDPRTSAIDSFCRSHEVRNLFVADGASFVSNPEKNPTLTIIALAWRAAEHLASEAQSGGF